VIWGQFDCYLRSGVACSHYQHTALTKLGWAAIFRGVELDDALIEVGCKRWNPGRVRGPGCDDNVLGKERVGAAVHLEKASDLGNSVDLDTASDREPELAGVGLHVIGGLVFGRIR
jgi:hypothetical protein